MDQRVSFITLGVADVARSRAFYERLGWRASSASQATVAFFDLGGTVLSLFGRAALAEDAHISGAGLEAAAQAGGAFSGIALACNQPSEAMVDAVLAEAAAAGARLLKPGQKVFWGGYSGYFADPDGHLWEVAYNPFAPLDSNGRVRLPR